MKKMYMGVFMMAVVLFSFVYWGSVRSKSKEEPTDVIKKESIMETSETFTQEVVKIQEPCVTKEMNYTHILEDELTGEKEMDVQMMPEEFLGLRRNELINVLQEKTKSSYSSKEGMERVHYELISFSSSGITIKETILVNPNAYTCFVVAEGEFVNIYTADRASLYMDTMLYRNDFSEDVQDDLVRGIYMVTVMDLYDFLQNHTS